MISKTIDWCNNNRFLVFLFLVGVVLAGAWSLDRISLDALPDISDVEVIIHTEWMGEPPDIIEDQVTYPIVTTMLAAPHVKAVRAQTMFNDSYVFVVFQDGTDLYWARSRVLEYISSMAGKLPPSVAPSLGPDAIGVGWGLEAALFSGVIPILLIKAGERRGHWGDRHVRRRQDRLVVIPLIMASVVCGMALMLVGNAPSEMVALMAAMLAGVSRSMKWRRMLATCPGAAPSMARSPAGRSSA